MAAKLCKEQQISFGNIEDITRWREDMNFMFEWQEQYYYMEKPIQQKQKAGIVTSGIYEWFSSQ